jgi:peptide/nickel transport system ATP-binding protein
VLLISHDLGVLAQTADTVAVMYAGRIVETGPARDVFEGPRHPYTQGLIAALPAAEARSRLRAIDGVVPAPHALPPGCAFAPRCPKRFDACDAAVPALVETAPGRASRCLLPLPPGA